MWRAYVESTHLAKWTPEVAQIPQPILIIIAACMNHMVLLWTCLYAANASLVARPAIMNTPDTDAPTVVTNDTSQSWA